MTKNYHGSNEITTSGQTVYMLNKMHIYLLVPVSSWLHGLSGSVLVPTVWTNLNC